jgi:Kef-type K+ transport system membrane component KefB
VLTSAALVSAIALVSPLLVRLLRLPVPDVVLQILLGVVVGPQVLGWASADEAVRVLALVGLSFLLFLAGLELEPDRLRGRPLRVSMVGFALSFAIALVLGQLLAAAGLVRSPVLIAVILSATALGIVLPVLKDAGRLDQPLGQLVVTGASLAEVLPVVLLSLLFSEEAAGLGSQLTLFAAFLALVAVAGVVLVGLERWPWVGRSLVALQETTAEIRVRAAVALLMAFAAVASAFGLEAILGAFLAGATVSFLDRDDHAGHEQFRPKLQAVGFGALIPFFFVATGMALDVRSLGDPATLARVPVFLVALLVVRGVPALVYLPILGSVREVVAAGLLQATSLSVPIVGGSIGVELGLIRPVNYVALVAAGLVSVVVFPQVALALTRAPAPSPTAAVPSAPGP